MKNGTPRNSGNSLPNFGLKLKQSFILPVGIQPFGCSNVGFNGGSRVA
ncbi:MAG: hypothetical protein IJS73_01635 [Paludibacteraceae bacterium]|nr:hypothetical protein [Paludibacteraceae bacterium]